MATVNWITGIISITRAEMTLIQAVPTEIRQLDINALRLELRDREEDPDGRPWSRTHDYNKAVNISGVQLALVVVFLDPYTITFEDGQYAVNLLGGNTNLADRVNVNQVSIRANNSAGLVQVQEIQQLVYGDNEVTVNITTGRSGQTYPIGSRLPGFASNNADDAKFIADLRGINTFFIQESMSISSATADFSAGYRFVGQQPLNTVFTIVASAILDNCQFSRMTIQGSLDSNSILNECAVGNLSFFNGVILSSLLQGTITLGGGINASFNKCFDHSTGVSPGINMGGTGQSLTMTGFEGAIDISNSQDPLSTNFISGVGKVEFTPTITEGTFVVFGDMRIVSNAGPNANIIDRTSVGAIDNLRKIGLNRMITDPVTGLVTIYEDDDVTVLYQGGVTQDAAGLVPYNSASTKIDRRNKMT